jgi:hypothetical protein
VVYWLPRGRIIISTKENEAMGKGNNSQRNDKKNKKVKQSKKPAAKSSTSK